jgi:regulatory protein
MPDSQQLIRRAAMDLLARREHSREELARKLGQRFTEREAIAAVLDQLADEGLQSDARYARGYLHSRTERGFGPLRIRQEMSLRGIGEEDIEQAFAESEVDWRACAEQVLRRKYGEQPSDSYPQRARRARFLRYRGFPVELIRNLERKAS